MDEDANKPDREEPAPDIDRLLKLLEAQSAATRARRAPSSLQTPAFRYGVLIAIVVFAFAALGLLEWILSQIARPAHGGNGMGAQQSPASQVHGNPP